ncbi:MAG: hypothetical protein V3G53_04495, partial [Candidatus Enteromonas sp.]
QLNIDCFIFLNRIVVVILRNHDVIGYRRGKGSRDRSIATAATIVIVRNALNPWRQNPKETAKHSS